MRGSAVEHIGLDTQGEGFATPIDSPTKRVKVDQPPDFQAIVEKPIQSATFSMETVV